MEYINQKGRNVAAFLVGCYFSSNCSCMLLPSRGKHRGLSGRRSLYLCFAGFKIIGVKLCQLFFVNGV